MKTVLCLCLLAATPVLSLTEPTPISATRQVVVGYGASSYEAYQAARQQAIDFGGYGVREVGRQDQYDHGRRVWICRLTIEF